MQAVVPAKRRVDDNSFPVAAHRYGVVQDRRSISVEMLHELADSALGMESRLSRLHLPLVMQLDSDLRVQVGKFAQALLQRRPNEVPVAEGLRRGKEADRRSGPAPRRSLDVQRLDSDPALETGEVLLAVPPDSNFKPVRKRVDDRDADAVQSAGDLVAVGVEFPAGMQLRHYDLGGGDPLAFVDVHRNPAAVVVDGYAFILVNCDDDLVGMAGQSFVDAVVDDFINHVVETRPVVRVSDVHSRPLPNRFQAFQNLDGIRTVILLDCWTLRHFCIPHCLVVYI